MAYIRRSKGKKPPAPSTSTADELREMEKALEKELLQLQKQSKDTKKQAEFERTFAACEKRHKAALKKGKVDEDFEEFLSDSIAATKKEINRLKREVEARKPENFMTLVAAGARPKRERNVALVVSVLELDRIIQALRYTEKSFGIVSPGSRPLINDVDRDVEKGSLDAYLLKCALLSGTGWATPVAVIHKDEGYETVAI